ncbi:MAG TPA: hypothetical protein VES02_06960, partial [Dermatophilaceae bacterium]|nr:hypothetical protein [Dermatophilaceae bacterium]
MRNDEQNDPGTSAIDVVDDGFRSAGEHAPGDDASAEPAADGSEGLRHDSAGHDAAITSFLTGEAALTSLRERPWTRFVSMVGYAVRDAGRGIRRRPGLAASAALTVS